MLKVAAKKTAAVALACALSLSAHAMADSKRAIDIPAGELGVALEMLARQSGADLVYRPEQVRGVTTRGVKGELSSEEAVAALLKGTPLIVSTDATGAMFIGAPKPISSRTSSSSTPSQHTGQMPGSGSTNRFHLAQASERAARSADARETETASSTDSSSARVDSEPGLSQESVEIEQVVVTGTHIGGITPVGSETITLGRDEIRATGMSNVTDVLRTVPAIQDVNDALREGGTVGGANATQGSALNLRGIGTNATLLLVDGRRVTPTGTYLSYTESNQVPIAALERIEVVADGASAIYGSDAVAGVVNYVVRKDYRGAELTARTSNQSGADEWAASLVAGTAWEKFGGMRAGNVLLAFEHADRDSMVSGTNPFLRQDLRRFGGPDQRLANNNATPDVPGNIVVPIPGQFGMPGPTNPDMPQAGAYTYWALPAGTNGTGLTAANLRRNQANILDSSDFQNYLGELNRDQATLHVNQQLSDHVSVYIDSAYTRRKTFSERFTSNNVTVRPGDPFYIAGIPGAMGQYEVQYNFTKDVGLQNTLNKARSYTVTAGVKAALPASWKGELYYTMGDDRICGVCNYGNNINREAFSSQVTQGNINPYSSQPLSASQIATFTGSNLQWSFNEIDNTKLKFDGPLFAVPGGKVRAAVGAEYLGNDYWLENSANRGVDNALTIDTTKELSETKRRVRSAFAELYVPIVGSDNRLPWVKALNLSLAYRYDDYSDAGETTNPRFGVTWSLNDTLAMRGSWGTSFRAPGLPEMNPYAYSSSFSFPFFTNNSGDPSIRPSFPGSNFTQPLILNGANSSLKPETATTWSFGLDFTPERIKGLRTSATFYSIRYKDKITGPNVGLFLSSPENRALYSQYITVINNPANCVSGDRSTYDPNLIPFLDTSLFPVIDNACNIKVVLDGRNTNVASSEQQGLDLLASYDISTRLGIWNVGASVNKILSYEEQALKLAPSVDRLDRYSNSPVGLRGRGNLTWLYREWNANLFVNYVGSYTNDQPLSVNNVSAPNSTVPSWTTLDAGFGYSVSDTASLAWTRGVRLSLNVYNVTDRNPPIVLSTGFGTSAYNANRSNPLGRTGAFTLTKAF